MVKSALLPGDIDSDARAAGRDAGDRVLRRLPPQGRIPVDGGDPAFTAPWELRAFAIVVALSEAGRLDWDRFQAELIDEIAGWEAQPEPRGEWSYYRRWLAAFERVAAGAMIEPSRVDERTDAILEVSSHAH
jgi:nitrile hydratase accessory protein